MDGAWGTVCHDYWDNMDASVTCRQLGFSPHGAISKVSYYAETVLPHKMFNVTCTGQEVSLFDCPFSAVLPIGSSCKTIDDAGVICQSQLYAQSSGVKGDIMP
jgi:deleted-in-malignant-brain-tumors protein 1